MNEISVKAKEFDRWRRHTYVYTHKHTRSSIDRGKKLWIFTLRHIPKRWDNIKNVRNIMKECVFVEHCTIEPKTPNGTHTLYRNRTHTHTHKIEMLKQKRSKRNVQLHRHRPNEPASDHLRTHRWYGIEKATIISSQKLYCARFFCWEKRKNQFRLYLLISILYWNCMLALMVAWMQTRKVKRSCQKRNVKCDRLHTSSSKTAIPAAKNNIKTMLWFFLSLQ